MVKAVGTAQLPGPCLGAADVDVPPRLPLTLHYGRPIGWAELHAEDDGTITVAAEVDEAYRELFEPQYGTMPRFGLSVRLPSGRSSTARIESCSVTAVALLSPLTVRLADKQ